MCSACHGALVIVKGDTEKKKTRFFFFLYFPRQQRDDDVSALPVGTSSHGTTIIAYVHYSHHRPSIRFASPRLKTPLTMPSVRVYDVDLGTSYWPIRKRVSMIDIHCNPTIVINKIVENF